MTGKNPDPYPLSADTRVPVGTPVYPRGTREGARLGSELALAWVVASGRGGTREGVGGRCPPGPGRTARRGGARAPAAEAWARRAPTEGRGRRQAALRPGALEAPPDGRVFAPGGGVVRHGVGWGAAAGSEEWGENERNPRDGIYIYGVLGSTCQRVCGFSDSGIKFSNPL